VPPNAIACPPALYEHSPRADRVTPKTALPADRGRRRRPPARRWRRPRGRCPVQRFHQATSAQCRGADPRAIRCWWVARARGRDDRI